MAATTGLALLVGALIDGIPESAAIGLSLHAEGRSLGIVLLAAVVVDALAWGDAEPALIHRWDRPEWRPAARRSDRGSPNVARSELSRNRVTAAVSFEVRGVNDRVDLAHRLPRRRNHRGKR